MFSLYVGLVGIIVNKYGFICSINYVLPTFRDHLPVLQNFVNFMCILYYEVTYG